MSLALADRQADTVLVSGDSCVESGGMITESDTDLWT